MFRTIATELSTRTRTRSILECTSLGSGGATPGQAVQLELDRRERLADGIVQLTGDVLAFVFLRGD
jgi:hypothetical protein